MRRVKPLLEISLLGGFRLVYLGIPVAGINTSRLQALIAYLLLKRARPVARQQLAFSFWPDTKEAQARTNLRHLLHNLRSSFPNIHDYLIVDENIIGWNSLASFTVDVDEFEQAASHAESAADLENALQRYPGELLPTCYEEWILPERERLNRHYQAALVRLVGLWEAAGNLDKAIQAARRLIHLEPMRENVYTTLMNLYIKIGDRAAALHTYQVCASTFQREMGLEPSQATRSVYQELLDEKPSISPLAESSNLPLVGRDDQWKQLATAWRKACSGKLSFVLIEGEAGIGKTRLAEELQASVERQGKRSVFARCYRAESNLAYSPLATWLRAISLPPLEPLWMSEISRILPELLVKHPEIQPPAPMAESWQRGHFHQGLAHALLDDGQPTLLVVDDIQWCDPDSLEWLHYLFRVAPAACMMVVATLRSDEIEADHPLAAVLSGLRRNRQLVEIAIGPLDESHTIDLARHVCGIDLNHSQQQMIYTETEGNPLFIVELARAGFFSSPNQLGAATNQTAFTLPPAIHSLISERLAKLSLPARQIADLASAIGRQFEIQILREISDMDEQHLVNGLDELWLRQIIRELGVNGYDFSHDKIRQVVYAELSHTRRRWLHTRCAEILEKLHNTGTDGLIGEVASHYEQAGIVVKAVTSYLVAARAALQIYANQEALRWLQRAHELLPKLPDPPQHARIILAVCESKGDVLKTLGQRPQAILAYQQALPPLIKAEPLDRSRLARKLGNTWVEDRRYDAAWECFTQAQTVLETNSDSLSIDWQREWLQVRLAQMQWHYWMYQWEQIAAIAEQIQTLIDQFGTPLQQMDFYRLIARKAFLQAGFQGTQDSLQAASHALIAARDSGDENAIATSQFSYGFQLLWNGDLEPASRAIFGLAVLFSENR